ncbi:hypothetical protein CTI14_71715, partial [Methylobacterium radiotolerans]
GDDVRALCSRASSAVERFQTSAARTPGDLVRGKTRADGDDVRALCSRASSAVERFQTSAARTPGDLVRG